MAEIVRAAADPALRFRFEVPVGRSNDLRAADVVIEQDAEINLMEIERGLFDFQAQLRAAQLKRGSLAEMIGRSVNLIIAVPDTLRSRTVLAPHAAVIASALPIPSRRIWAALRGGQRIKGDGLLWVRIRRAQLDAPHASHRA